MLNPTLPVSVASKFRGCILGALVGDCMAARFDKSPESFASIASRIEPSSLRNQIPRNGGRFLFPHGVDSVMLLATAESVKRSFASTGSFGDASKLSTLVRKALQDSLEEHSRNASSVQWGVGTKHVLETSVGSRQLRSNCGVTRALVAGLVDAEKLAEPLCTATHTHPSATSGALTVARAVKLAVFEDRLLSASDVSEIPSYDKIVHKAVDLATHGSYSEDDEFSTILQDRFRARFGADASSQCAVAAATFAVHRTVHALPYLDASSREYRERISQVTQAGTKKKQLGIAANTLGNSNRLDTASLFSALTPSIEQDLPVAIAVAWAISLGGDVRSNACLAGGLAGALWGQEAIPDEWLMFSEGVDYARAVADSLLHLTQGISS